ncbi:hypothetical protein [Kitasatospora sp. NPDC059327]|uniref:hypothetical protein n=1 Tax=Kitasatospora sp. NPDC059327 TaxID=3346803 RepID=UPI0036B7C0DB
MSSPVRRPLWRPFSEPATDTPVRADDRARLLAVERAPFLEPAAAVAPEVAPGGRRRLGPGGLAAGSVPGGRG